MMRATWLLACIALLVAARAGAEPRITRVFVEGAPAKNGEVHFGLEDTFGVELEGAEALNGTPDDPVGLFLDNVYLSGISPEPEPGNPKVLRFRLRRLSEDGANKESWTRLLARRPSLHWPVSVAVGTRSGKVAARYTAPAEGPIPKMRLLRGAKGALVSLFALALLVGILAIGVKTTALRDADARHVGGKVIGTYSLARVQMALWTVNVMIAYLAIWAITGSVDSLSESALALLGIGSGTALGAALIEGGQAPREPQPSAGFISDLLSDENGFSLHRVQLLGWTVVMTIVFWGGIAHSLAMPQFDTTMLALMGISSGTYLGFKLPEANAAKAAAAQKAGAQAPVVAAAPVVPAPVVAAPVPAPVVAAPVPAPVVAAPVPVPPARPAP
jgi:hypothetical protein